MEGALSRRLVFCPVPGCTRSTPTTGRGFTNHQAMRTHLNEHCWGVLLGAVPQDYMDTHQLGHCSHCHGLIHNRYHNLCPTCRPAAAAARAAANLRTRLAPANTQEPPDTPTRVPLPSLQEIHTRYVPTQRHVPKELRKLWARCCARTLATVAWSNDVDAWAAQQMLTKSVLCSFPRGGRAHKNQRLAWTRARLKRWLDGERGTLWQDLPHYSPPRAKRPSEHKQQTLREQR